MNDKVKKFTDIFTNPNRIIEYSKEKWSFFKYSLIIIIAGLLFGFNFFFSNFLILVKPQIYIWVLGICAIGVIMLDIFIYVYILLLWILIKVFLNYDERMNIESKNQGSNEKKDDYITKENFLIWIKVFSYCFLIPFLIYNLIFFLLIILLLALKLTYVIVYISNLGKFILYAWILAITLYSTQNINKSQKYKINTIILGSFILSYAICSFLNFQGVILLTEIILNA